MSDKKHTINCITPASDLGGMMYPFLQDFSQWEIHTWPVRGADPHTEKPVTLRWVKDDKVNDLFIDTLNHDAFCIITGLKLDITRKGPFVLSKRLSRLMRPYRFFRFYDCSPDPHTDRVLLGDAHLAESLVVNFSPQLDTASWDGCALITRGAVRQMGLSLSHLPEAERALHQHELETCKRWELTVMHPGGQEKGHAYVVERDEAWITVPAGATKSEVALDNRLFVGLQPVHSRDDMRLDVQSLINLHPFFSNEQLLTWMQDESTLFLNRIKTGQIDVILSKITGIHSAEALTRLRQWHMGEYLMSGGSLMWFPGAVKAMTNQFLKRLRHGETNFRFPVAGGRYYIFPHQVGRQQVSPGHIMLDPDAATAWVNQEDWNNYIVNVLGGCDGDDALWIVPFTDHDGTKQVLAWRSPNQFGEYVLLQPTEDSHTIVWETVYGSVTWPRLDSRKLPPRIDQVAYTYGELEPFPSDHADAYSIAAMQPAIINARANGGVLGAYCNALMVWVSTFGDMLEDLPARLEDVIDGSVKAPVDLSPVLSWIASTMQEIAAEGHPISSHLYTRIAPSLSEDDEAALIYDPKHWLTVLMEATERHIHTYLGDAQALMAECEPPEAIFTQGNAWQGSGSGLITAFQQGLQHQGITAANQQAIGYLEHTSHPSEILLGAAARIYLSGFSDSVLWQLDLADGTPGTARRWLTALRHIGLLSEPVWTTEGTVLYHHEQKTAVPFQINGTWFNYLNLKRDQPYTAMNQPQIKERQAAKEYIHNAATNGRFNDMLLYTEVTPNNRVRVRGPQGNLLGYVQKGQELQAAKSRTWRIQHAAAQDGNLQVIAAYL